MKQFTFGAVSPNVAMIKNNGKPMNIGEVVDCLNEQQTTIKQLKKENENIISKNCTDCELVNLQTKKIDELEDKIIFLSDSHQSYIEMDSETHSKVNDIIRTQRGKIFRLEKENEGLDDENAKLLSERIRDLEIFEECVDKARKLKEENEQLRFELETHKHPLWSTREAERKVNNLTDSLADEVKKNGLLNEEINQLRIENMRLKKAEKINMEYVEQIVKENQKLRIAKNDLRIENDRLRQKIEKVSDMLDEIDFFSTDAVTYDTIAYREMMKFDNKDAHSIACNLKGARQILEGVSDE